MPLTRQVNFFLKIREQLTHCLLTKAGQQTLNHESSQSLRQCRDAVREAAFPASQPEGLLLNRENLYPDFSESDQRTALSVFPFYLLTASVGIFSTAFGSPGTVISVCAT